MDFFPFFELFVFSNHTYNPFVCIRSTIVSRSSCLLIAPPRIYLENTQTDLKEGKKDKRKSENLIIYSAIIFSERSWTASIKAATKVGSSKPVNPSPRLAISFCVPNSDNIVFVASLI